MSAAKSTLQAANEKKTNQYKHAANKNKQTALSQNKRKRWKTKIFLLMNKMNY